MAALHHGIVGSRQAHQAAYALARELPLTWDAGAGKWQAVDLIVKRLARELARLDSIESVMGTREAIQQSVELLRETMASVRAKPADALIKPRVFLHGDV